MRHYANENDHEGGMGGHTHTGIERKRHTDNSNEATATGFKCYENAQGHIISAR